MSVSLFVLYDMPVGSKRGVDDMPRSKIQFQKGLSEVAFQEQYGTEAQCRAALETMRWPEGFVCPACGGSKSHRLDRRALYQCSNCHTQTSLTAGTIFEHTKLPLSVWFRGMYHLTQSKNGVSAMELMRRLGVSYNTAWMLKQKVMQVMLECESRQTLRDRVEIDDAYIGGERPGKIGRGADGKTPIVAAVQTDWEGRPQYIALHKLSGFTNEQIEAFAKKKLDPKADVYSDGLACFGAVISQGCSHSVTVTGGGRTAAKDPTFKWVNTALGNIKSALTGTYRHVSPNHVARYLAEFQYRFNQRHDLAGMLARLSYVAIRTPPMPGKLLKLAETSG